MALETAASNDLSHDGPSTLGARIASYGRYPDTGVQQLLVIVCLPLANGIFPALLAAGEVRTPAQILTVAFTIFTGAGALTVLYSHADSRREARRLVTPTAIALVVGAVIASLVAPVFATMFAVSRLGVVTGVVILLYAAVFLGLPGTGTVPTNAVLLVGFGLSIADPSAIAVSTTYLRPALLTALVAVGGLYLAASIHPSRISVTAMRTGGGIVLACIGLSVLGVAIPTALSLGLFGLTVVVALVSGNSTR